MPGPPVADPVAEHGRSDRTQLALLSTRLPAGAAGRLAPLLQRGGVGVLHGIGAGLRLPARAVAGHTHARLLMLGQLEIPVQEALRRVVPNGAVVYDVGANIGFLALIAARVAGPDGRVLAFEPVAATAALAREAALRSGLAERVEVRAVAVGARSGREKLYVVEEASRSHLASRGWHPDTVSAVDVDVVTLDDVASAGAPPPAVIKIDVEGSEGDVLRGAHRVLTEHRPAVICELHETNDEVADLFEDAGYAVENLDGPEPIREAGAVRVLARPRR